MDPQYILIALLAVPVVLLLVLRVNAAFVFLSLCLGAVLVQFVAPDGATIVASFTAQSKGTPPNQSTVNLILQLLPVILTTIFMIHSVQGRMKNAYNLLPAIGASALLVLLTVPLLPYGLTASITGLEMWKTLENLQTLIISVSTLLTLLFLWMLRPKRHLEER